MPPPRVALGTIPALGRPAEVEKAIEEATVLRDRARKAQERTAAKQQELEEAEQADVEAAAERARAGAALGTTPAAVKKVRDQLDNAKREAAALGLAAERAATDLVAAMQAEAEPWLTALDAEAEQARQRGREAISALQAATEELGKATSATSWLRGAVEDGRFDRSGHPGAGSVAPSSARRTANSEPLRTDELLAFARELVDPPAAPTQPRITARAPAA